MNKQTVTTFAKNAKKTLSKHSPAILTGVGVVGMWTSVGLAVNATPKALKMIENAQYDKGDNLTTVEKVKVAWKPYVPAVVTGVTATACLVGANSVNVKRNAALATAYQLSTTAFNEYKAKVVETIGEKKEKVVREKIAKDHVEKAQINKAPVIVAGSGDTLFMDSITNRVFTSDIETIRKKVNDLNYRMTTGMEEYISLNEFYSEIGLSGTKNGDDLGWNLGKEGPIEVEFSACMADNGKPCLYLDYLVAPRYNYSKLM